MKAERSIPQLSQAAVHREERRIQAMAMKISRQLAQSPIEEAAETSSSKKGRVEKSQIFHGSRKDLARQCVAQAEDQIEEKRRRVQREPLPTGGNKRKPLTVEGFSLLVSQTCKRHRQT